MSPRQKIAITLVIWLVADVGFIQFSASGSNLTGLAAVGGVIATMICGIITLSVRCRSCGKSVINNPLFGDPRCIWVYGPFVPRKCSRCGYDLTQPDQKK